MEGGKEVNCRRSFRSYPRTNDPTNDPTDDPTDEPTLALPSLSTAPA